MSNIYYTTWKGKRSGYNYRLEITPASSTALVGSAAGNITGANQTTLGSGYSSGTYACTGGTGSGFTVTVTTTTGAALTISLTTGGSGYSDNHSVATTGGTGTGLRVVVTTAGGIVSTIAVADAGSGYTATDVVTIADGDNLATFRVDSVTNGAATISSIVNHGSGYTAGDVLTIVGGNNDSTITVTTVSSSGDTYIEFPKGLVKMKSLKSFEYKDIPIGMPEGASLDYELDIYNLSINASSNISTELLSAVLYPTLNTTVQGVAITLGTIHELMIDKGTGVYTTVYKGIQRLGAEQGLSSDSDFISIESQSVERYAMNCISGRDIITARANGGDALTFVAGRSTNGTWYVYDTLVTNVASTSVFFTQMRSSVGTNDIWYFDSPDNVMTLYYDLLTAVMRKMVRLTTFTFDTSNNKLFNLTTYYKRKPFNALFSLDNSRGSTLATSDLRYTYLINTGENSQDTFANGFQGSCRRSSFCLSTSSTP